MKTSIATVSISGDLSEKLAAIAAAGFDGVEIFEADLLTYDATPAEVGRMVRDAGLALTLFQPFRDFEGMPEPQRARAFDRAERKFDLMGELGADLILVCSNTSPVSLGGIDRAAADLRELGDRASARGIRIGFEALAWGRHVNDHRDAWEIVRRADHAERRPHPRQLPHPLPRPRPRLDPLDPRRQALPRPARRRAGLPRWTCSSGAGTTATCPARATCPSSDFLAAVAATGYDGWLSLEIFNDQFRGGSPRSISVDGHRSLVALMDEVQRAEPGRPARSRRCPTASRSPASSSSSSPPRPRPRPRWSASSTAWASRKAGRHVSKDVTLYRQGGINLVVNTEREGFAHSAYLTHGVGVCDIGFRVEERRRHRRARRRPRRPDSSSSRIGPGELAIPAIRGVGGAVMHFLDQSPALAGVWETEFVPAEDDVPVADTGLVAVDHLAQTMPYDEMLSWAALLHHDLPPREGADRRHHRPLGRRSAARRSRTPTAPCA